MNSAARCARLAAAITDAELRGRLAWAEATGVNLVWLEPGKKEAPLDAMSNGAEPVRPPTSGTQDPSQESRHKVEQLMTDLSPSNNHQGRKLRATIDNVHLGIYLPYESQLGGKLRLKVEVLAEYPDELSFEKWTLLRLEAHIATKMAALLDRHFSEKGQKDAREILALMKLGGVEPAVAAEILHRASTVDIQDLPTMIGGAFDLIGKVIRLSKADQKLIAAAKKSWGQELHLRALSPQSERPRL
ncbi:hypothetical protein E3O06_17170 [Cryobacterium glaciale]|uniref:Uncharacterized protein n=1 Tax=Cryobacterium glaciale TaxID=1259145 RepID=A0A4R8UMN7_9MICO|nr:hypothetical protein [Cryobacterium glaciale]TFB67759.1 hypothetical protein E3O06_17170 [Cryobacterium glaciale]